MLHSDLEIGLVLLEDVIVQLADRERDRDLGALLARRAGLDARAVAEALRAPSEEPTVRLCRAAGVNLNGYSAILRMRRRRGVEDGASPSALLRAYQADIERHSGWPVAPG
jgi:hypothetical protein